ncbi:hypothetical protein FACS1894181_01560 [Bacteroidia bacterium]|nr:hypothetical protein FACS1894181_01560 [Bacteroidia bacterium]
MRGKEAVKEGIQYGYHIVEGLRIDVQENAATIAGIKCTKYSCYAMSYTELPGNIIQGDTDFRLEYSVWFDFETDIVMRFEDLDYKNPEYNVRTGYIKYWFEINEIEFNKVKKADIKGHVTENWPDNEYTKQLSKPGIAIKVAGIAKMGGSQMFSGQSL